jgi:hypothetical protein
MRSGLISVILLTIPAVACAQSNSSATPPSNTTMPKSEPAVPSHTIAALQSQKPQDTFPLPRVPDQNLAPKLGDLVHKYAAVTILSPSSDSACGHIILYQAHPVDQTTASVGSAPHSLPDDTPLPNFDSSIRLHAMPPCSQDIRDYVASHPERLTPK